MAEELISKTNRAEGHKVDAAALEADLKAHVDGEVRFDLGSRGLYSTDGSNWRQVPIGVVVPRTIDAVVETVAACRRHQAPLFSRGGGTSLAGQCCNVAVVMDFSKYLNRILEIDPDRKLARVEPGTITDDLRHAADTQYHLTYGPDPATHTHNTFGGMIGNNSCGIHSVMAGRTADNVHELEILTYDGVRMRVGPTSEEELSRIIAAGGRRGEIYRGLRDLRDRYAGEIRKRYPKIPRRVSGYNLDDLLPENGFNVARALVGSESTCVTILEATVNLVHSPPGRALLVLGYPDVFQAGDHVPQIMEHKPIGLEGIDLKLVEYMKKKGLHPQDVDLLPSGGGWLLAEFGADTVEQARDHARQVMEALKKEKSPPSMKLFTDAAEEHMVWEIRESGLGATANVPGEPLSWTGWEDAAVRPDKVGEYLRDFRKLLMKYHLDCALYGHFGQGCIHCRITFDLVTHGGIKSYLEFIDQASDLVVKYGGSFSGEHGDGQSRAVFLPKMYGTELVKAFHEFKTLWDPDWLMNPGKVVDPYLPDENLRLGLDYRPWQPETHYKFPDDHGSMARGILRCVGVGKCRRTGNTGDVFMCPSFLATREEKDTTRGRARLLFEMFRGTLITDGWRSKEVRESLDLCLGCKGCKSECPVNVDMATYKSEFLSHHYHHRLRPPQDYAMGLIGYWAAIGSHVPRLANFFTQTPGLDRVAKALGGISQKRKLPRFAAEPFTAWFRARGGSQVKGETVLLYPDMFNDCFYPQSLQAAVEVLERWGFHVILPERRPPAIRPLLHYGMLHLGKKKLQYTIELLRPYVDHGISIIILEPSTASVFRDDLLQLVPNDEDGMRLSKLSMLIGEFADRRNLPLPKLQGQAVFHGHCHQKAVLEVEAARNILRKMGLSIVEPQPGCCGMAGSFGFESHHYDLSMKIAEEHLLPTVRQSARDTLIVADGFSCRTQIFDGTGRMPMHMAELFKYAFEHGIEAPGHQEERIAA